MRTTATVDLTQQAQENSLPFCLFDQTAMFHAIEFTYPMLVSFLPRNMIESDFIQKAWIMWSVNYEILTNVSS